MAFITNPRRTSLRRVHLSSLAILTTTLSVAALAAGATAHADEVAYLVNVTVRPGYNFSNADAALDYGRGICDQVAAGQRYEAVISRIAGDFGTSDEYQAGYLINQAVNELCPQHIWQLRQSAAGYQPTAR